MANKIYPCFSCGEWFETVGMQKAHKCGVKPLPKVEVVERKIEIEDEDVVVEETITPVETSSENEDKENTEFDRKEVINALKEAGKIVDGRAVSGKSDEELMEMLKEV